MQARSTRRPGLTLVEILVVVAVLGLLLALAIPAVMAASAWQQRVECGRRLQAIGLAINAYSSDHGCLPLGRVSRFDSLTLLAIEVFREKDLGSPETSWAVPLLAHLEYDQLYHDYNFELGILGRMVSSPTRASTGYLANQTVITTLVGAYCCPADEYAPIRIKDAEQFGLPGILSTGNFAAVWGNTNWSQLPLPKRGKRESIEFRRGAFGSKVVRLADIASMASHRAAVTEVVRSPTGDVRGVFWFPVPGSVVMSRLPPNATLDTYGEAIKGDRLPLFCESSPWTPCDDKGTIFDSFVGARSLHSGGVHVLHFDGSVHFVSNSIDPMAWMERLSIDLP